MGIPVFMREKSLERLATVDPYGEGEWDDVGVGLVEGGVKVWEIAARVVGGAEAGGANRRGAGGGAHGAVGCVGDEGVPYEDERPGPTGPCVVTVGLLVCTVCARLRLLPPVVDADAAVDGGCDVEVAEGAFVFVAEGVEVFSSASSVYAGGGGSSSLISATSCQGSVVVGVAATIGAGAPEGLDFGT